MTLSPIERFNNICKALEENLYDSPYSAESWDQLTAENDALRSRLAALEAALRKPTMEMVEFGVDEYNNDAATAEVHVGNIFRAMISALPDAGKAEGKP